MSTRRRFLVRACLTALALAGIAVALWVVGTFNPTGYGFFPKCQFHSVTGLHCIGCGLTRSLHAWLNLDPLQGLAYHPLSFILLPYVGWSLGLALWRWAWGGESKRSRFRGPPWLIWSFVWLLMIFWVVRNIPIYPFNLLAPHELVVE